MAAIIVSTEKRTYGTEENQDNAKSKLVNFESRNLVPSGRWQWRSRWQVGTPSQWEVNSGDTNRVGKWIMPWAKTDMSNYSHASYRGYYNSRIPYAPRDHWYRHKDFRPGNNFSRYRNYHHYYPFGHFYRHSYPRYFTSFWSYPFWSWYWYPSWWAAYDHPYAPGYSYYDYWYPRRYYHPEDAYHNKYFARITTEIEPDETLVYLDGQYIGQAKEHNGWWLTYPVKAGDHHAELKLQGFQIFAMDFKVAPTQYYKISHQMTRLTPAQNKSENNSLEKEPVNYQRGNLILEIQPNDASVFIDNKFIGTFKDSTHPDNKIMLESGKHIIYIVSPAYIPYNSEFTISPQEDTHLNIILKPRQSI